MFFFRCSETFHLGLAPPEDAKIGGESDAASAVRYSPHVVCRDVSDQAQSQSRDEPPQQQQPATYLSLTKACLCVVRSLSEEKDWLVLRLILSKVPTVLQNKAIITRYGKAIHMFVNPLVKLTQRESGYPESLFNTPSAGFSRAEFHNQVFPVLAAMASYNEYLVRRVLLLLQRNVTAANLFLYTYTNVGFQRPAWPDQRPSCGSPLSRVQPRLHRGPHRLRPGDEEDHVPGHPASAAQLLQDFGHQTDRDANVGVPLHPDQIAR